MTSKYMDLRDGSAPTDIIIKDQTINHHARKYHNRNKHPECQDINLTDGFRSAVLKQMEINEELLRALIDIEMTNLSKPKKEEMIKKYKELI